MLTSAYICDAIRTPFCRQGGMLAAVRADDLAALPLMALAVRNPAVDWECLDEVCLGCANQAGEDNRNLARMALLLAGLPPRVPGVTLNRQSGSGLEALGMAARAIRCGEAALVLAGGAESMSRAPFVLAKTGVPFARRAELYDSCPAGRFGNLLLQARYGADSAAQAAGNVAREFGIERAAQEHYARSSRARAQAAGPEPGLTAVTLAARNGDPLLVERDDGAPCCGQEETAAVAADGACALLLAGEKSAYRYSLLPRARLLGMAAAGTPPRLAGIGAGAAARRLLARLGLTLEQMDVIELDEAHAAPVLAVLRDWGLQDDDGRVNPAGGALACGHPCGASGARLVADAVAALHRRKGRYALCAMGVESGQGLALLVERV